MKVSHLNLNYPFVNKVTIGEGYSKEIFMDWISSKIVLLSL